MTKISVIIPIYNVEEYLKECLNSIINQTLSDIEIICIDDNSTDRSLEILKEYKKKDCRITILNQNNKGGGAARNQGIEKATGDYLIFLDSDDFFETNLLEELYNLAKNNNTDIAICYDNSFNTTTKNFTERKVSYFPNNIKELEIFNKESINNIINYFNNAAWNKLYKRDFIIKNNLRFQEIQRTNDLFFVKTSLLLAKKIIYTNKILVHYRTGQETNCQSNNHKCPTEFLKALYAIYNFLIENNLFKAQKRNFEELATNVITYNLNSLNDYPNEKKQIILSLIKNKSKLLTFKTFFKISFKQLLKATFSIRNNKNKNGKIITFLGKEFIFKKK